MARRPSLLVLTILVCCSSGGGGGGSDDEVTVIANGSITVIGSAAVTGTVWDTDDALVLFDGVEADAADLDVGMVALVEGRRSRQPGQGTASRIEVESSVAGPIASVVDLDDDLALLGIVGRSVRVERETTLFGGTPADFDFDTMAVDDLVVVWGFVDGDEEITATRVEKRGVLGDGLPTVRLQGAAMSWMPIGSGGSFEIGDVLVLYEDTDLSGLPGGAADLADEPFVTVDGAFDPARDEVDATRVEERADFEGDFGDLEIEGIVSEFSGIRSRFRVGGQRVDADFFVALEPEDLGDFLEDGMRVEVEGSLLDGVVIAAALKQSDAEARVSGEIAAQEDVNVVDETIALLGVTIQVDAATRLEDERSDPVDPLTLADMMAGDHLVVRGLDTGGSVRAMLVRRTEPGDVTLRGRVQNFVGPPDHQRFTLLDHLIRTDATTVFEDFPGGVVSEIDFYTFLFANRWALLDVTGPADDPTRLDEAAAVEYEE